MGRYGSSTAGASARGPHLDGGGRGDPFHYDPRSGRWAGAVQGGVGEFAARAAGAWRPGAAVAVGDLNDDRRGDLLLADPSPGGWLTLFGPRTLGLVVGDSGTFDLTGRGAGG